MVEHTEQRLLIRDLFRVAFFIPHDNFDIAEGVSQALDSYLRAVVKHPEALALYTCGYWEPSRLDDRGWTLIREVLHPTARRYIEDASPDEAFHPEKDGADPYFSVHAEDESGFYFGYHARIPSRHPSPDSVSVLRITLPTEYLEAQGPDFVRGLVLDMASRLPFASGHAGMALSCWPSLDAQLARLQPLLVRHPGFDLRDANIHAHPGTRVDGIHWLNFLGQSVMEVLGGAVGLRAQLHHPATAVQELDGQRAVITLGPSPETGDLPSGESLPAYRELARVLERCLEPFPWKHHRFADPSTETTLRHWWRRFLD